MRVTRAIFGFVRVGAERDHARSEYAPKGLHENVNVVRRLRDEHVTRRLILEVHTRMSA